MSHGQWQGRSLDEQARELIIIFTLLLLYIPSFRHRSYTLFMLTTIAIIQHIHGLVNGTDLIPTVWIFRGCWLMAVVGFWHHDLIVYLAGTYSFVSKFNVNLYLHASWPITHLEANKAIVSVLIWIVLVALQSIWIRRREYRKVKHNLVTYV
jgi:hypothetical protein